MFIVDTMGVAVERFEWSSGSCEPEDTLVAVRRILTNQLAIRPSTELDRAVGLIDRYLTDQLSWT